MNQTVTIILGVSMVCGIVLTILSLLAAIRRAVEQQAANDAADLLRRVRDDFRVHIGGKL